MSVIAKQLEEVWNALRAAGAQRGTALDQIRIRNLRGIRDLRVRFQYPVSVLAGPNGCGKSTVLFACACAYRPPSGRTRNFTPSSVFPNFVPNYGMVGDVPERTELVYDHRHVGDSTQMTWKRVGSRWRRSFGGRRGVGQPQRSVHLRTLANLANPSEVRSLLQIGRRQFDATAVTPDRLVFAHRILPWRYRSLSAIVDGRRDLLFAELEGDSGISYSEFHMSSGERSVVRLSWEISQLHDALVLVDEVETGLHPYTQQLTMLELQRIALRQRLQIIVASHSPVVLDSVPLEGRIFLDRDPQSADVSALPPYRDIFQKALYGQSRDQLSILCEDAVAEGLILGVLDVLAVRMALRHDDFVIGRDTGRDEFPAYVRMLAKVGKLQDFVLVLDGDSRNTAVRIGQVANQVGQYAEPLFLPGEESPEVWIWDSMRRNVEEHAEVLGLTTGEMRRRMRATEQIFEGSIGRKGDVAKGCLDVFATDLNRRSRDVARIAGRVETEKGGGGMAEFVGRLQEQIEMWRQL